MATPGKIIIISAPSGSGKSTIIRELTDTHHVPLTFSVSATNRPPRTGETDGVHYHFLSDEAFRSAIAADEFVEYEEVYPGRFYGTLKSEVERRAAAGENVLLDIDVKGGCRVKEMYADGALSIFIMPPGIDELRRRLEGRATDPQEAIEARLSKAAYEMEFAPRYDAVVVNDDLATASAEVARLITDFIAK
ncbi:MAG: guanylate kinase [Paramuribaculum sp.]|nr:guanylate kinase [Paramuribaculum sp.]